MDGTHDSDAHGLIWRRLGAHLGCARTPRGREDAMPMYVSLVRYTDQGIRTIKDSPARLETVKKTLKAAGGE